MGPGFVLKGIQETLPSLCLEGSEIFDDGLTLAQARLPGVDLYQMDARQIPFESEFDVIGAFDVLEHIVEDDAVLTQMFRATRAGGGVLITVPQHPFLWSASDEHALHQRRYSRAELRKKVERSGFQVERITSFVSLLLPLMICSRMKRKSSPAFQLWEEFEIAVPQRNLRKYPERRTRYDSNRHFFSSGRLSLANRQEASGCTVIRIPFNRPFATGDEIDYIRSRSRRRNFPVTAVSPLIAIRCSNSRLGSKKRSSPPLAPTRSKWLHCF